jgi:diguanylate cyclase (GGDEF)-like protein/PAS domain S-box-containing protein
MNAPGPLQALLRPPGPPPGAVEALLAQTRHAVVVGDARLRVTWANAAFGQLTGVPPPAAVGQRAPRLLRFDGSDASTLQRLRAALAAGQSFHGLLLGRGRDARRLWLDVEVHPFAADGRPPAGFVAVMANLTHGRLAVEQLRATFDNAAAGFVVQDDAGRIVDCNPAAEELLGLTRDQLLGVTSVDPRWRAIDSDGADLPGEQHPAMRTLRSGEPVHGFVMGIALPGGGRRWLLVNTSTLPLDGGSGWVVSSFVDLSAQRRLEHDLAEQSRRLRALFERAPIGLALLDVTAGRIVDSNPAMTRLVGFSREQCLEGLHLLDGPHEQLQRREAMRQALLRGESVGPVEAALRHREGHALPVSVSTVAMDDVGGQRCAWMIVQDISARKAMEAELMSAARNDLLTGLPNRSSLMARLEALAGQARRAPAFGFAVLFLDFDRFKLVNDTLGHEAGDELLRQIALRLIGALPEQPDGDGGWLAARVSGSGWVAARFGGDEFVVVAPGLGTPAAVRPFAERLVAELSLPYEVKGREIHSGASIGIALGSAERTDPEALLRDADTAMYEAKRRGRRTLVFFDDTMRERLTRAVRIEEALRHAVRRGELSVRYQPIVDLETGEPSSVEALMRWSHPELGAVSPEEFIPIAEETGHIVELGRWVLVEACAAWARWQAQAPAHAPRAVSINLSRLQIVDGSGLVATVRSALAAAQMPAQALQLELTEREVMKDPAGARALIDDLRALGVRIAMDDFGTGTSSLACLREYPFDAVKIDKSFVTNLCSDAQVLAVAHATVNVIENLGMSSVAEGIEDAAEVAALQAMGCRYGQGYLFARPLDEAALLEFFAAGPVG